ncbi:hypothetical protein G6O69_03495 [Pseudenhygromyxa sp. WMMC2535]|uniref:hypothetical protein n=1 Tax=Pseudenhygromyxa sp. WMMC2535 TaxID=2712867 RepID=UPI0015954CE0|nr:hypothetical protein [Pseudenhygromyxa sp. WMMC2535]NVB36879.1 hypothetical protein [Pseudenhygromyxa sp. WMMC2535]
MRGEVSRDELIASFEEPRSTPRFEYTGSIEGLRARWDALCKVPRHGRRARELLGKVAVLVAMVLVALNLAWVGGMFELGPLEAAPQWFFPVLTSVFVAGGLLAVSDSLGLRAPALDARKLGLAHELVCHLERRLCLTDELELRVDFGPSCRDRRPPSPDPVLDWCALALPDAEPSPHDWLYLYARVDGRELRVRLRTLFGRWGEERRLRDELAVDIRGQGLATARTLALPDAAETELIAESLAADHVQLLFRGRGAARHCPPSVDELETGWPTELKRDHLNMRRYELTDHYEDIEWLLGGRALVEHVEFALAVARGVDGAGKS